MSNIIIPSDPKSRAKIKGAIDEICGHLTQIDAFRSKIKEILDTMKDEVDIKPKYIRKLATLQHKQKVSEFQAEADDLDALYETVMGGDK